MHVSWVSEAMMRSLYLCICASMHPPTSLSLSLSPSLPPSLPLSAARLEGLAARHPSGGELAREEQHVRLVEHHRLPKARELFGLSRRG